MPGLHQGTRQTSSPLCSLYSNERRWNTDIKQEISELHGMLEGVKYCGSRVKGEGVLGLLE